MRRDSYDTAPRITRSRTRACTYVCTTPCQVAANTEGVQSLTRATYKRVDEHASAIQRLAEVRAYMSWNSLRAP